MSNPKYEPTTTVAKLGWVIEECSELGVAIGKTLRHGLTSVDPTDNAKRNADGSREMNVDWILREMADAEKAICLARTAIIREVGSDDSDMPPRVDAVHVPRANYEAILFERDQLLAECDRLRGGLKQTLHGVLDALDLAGEWTTPTQRAAAAHLRALLLGYEGVAK